MEVQPYRQLNASESSERTVCLCIYGLFVFVCVTGFLGPLAGFILAKYQKNKMSTELGVSHINAQISFFVKSIYWILGGVVYTVIASAIDYSLDLRGGYDIFLLPGLIVLVIVFLWFLFKSIIGASYLIGGRNP